MSRHFLALPFEVLPLVADCLLDVANARAGALSVMGPEGLQINSP